MNVKSEKLRVRPHEDMGAYALYRSRDYIKLETLAGVYEVVDASTATFGKSTVGFINGDIATYGTDMDDTLLSLIHQDICDSLYKFTIKDIKKIWKSS